jgi:AcrR family transcriptional regulator
MTPESTSRDRLLEAATQLFAVGGYRGASVRDICNLAGTNPGAVSYHFGGKRQLYRSVLRAATERLAALGATLPDEDDDVPRPYTERVVEVARRISASLAMDPAPVRLVVRDLADGGSVAVEALAPALRRALDALGTATGQADRSMAAPEVRRLLLELAAPVFLVAAGWPILAPALDLDPGERDALVAELVARTLRRV